MPTGFVYLVHNTLSNKVYCGQTIQKNPERRWNNHKYNSLVGKGNRHLTNSIRKYGVSSFEFSILEEISLDNVTTLKTAVTDQEDFWINYLKFLGFSLYNRRPASESNKGLKWTEDSRQSFSELKKGMVSTFKGKHHSEYTKLQLSQAHIGLHPSETSRLKMSDSQKLIKIGSNNPFYGKHHSEETKRKMSESHKKVGIV